MTILNKIILTVLILMSLAAGIPKILQMPQELEFLAHIGLSGMGVSLLGVIQLAGGALLVLKTTRRVGAILTVVSLSVSALALFMAGNVGMTLVTLVPILLGVVVLVQTFSAEHSGSQNEA